MNWEEDRKRLVAELEEVLDLYGAYPSKWPESKKARLSALVETDKDAMKLLADARAFDRLLGCCRKGEVRPGLEKCVLEAVRHLPQQHRPVAFHGVSAQRIVHETARKNTAKLPWRELALLAASLGIGIYIGLSGEAIPTLRDLNMMASADMAAGAAIAGSLIGPGGLHDQEPL